MPISGDRKKEYQREYMRSKSTGSKSDGSKNGSNINPESNGSKTGSKLVGSKSSGSKTQYCPRYNNEDLPCYHPCCYDFTKEITESVTVKCNQTGADIVLDRYFTTTDGVKVDRLNLPKAIARGSKIPAIQALRNQWHSKKKNLVKIEGI